MSDNETEYVSREVHYEFPIAFGCLSLNMINILEENGFRISGGGRVSRLVFEFIMDDGDWGDIKYVTQKVYMRHGSNHAT